MLGLGLAVSRAGVGAVLALFVLVVPFEKLFPRHAGQPLRRPQLGTDVAFALSSPLMQIATLVVALPIALLSFAWLPGLVLRPFVSALPPAAQLIAGFLLFDLAIYWAHRWAHEVPMLWRFHQIHHSPENMDWVSGFRNHPFDGAILAPPFVFLLAAGFDPRVPGALAVAQVVTGLFLHANVRWRLRPLQRFIATPEFHHWHHANEPLARNTNYAAFLPVWDSLFATYRVPADRRPSVYGVDARLPAGILAQLSYPLRGAPNPLRMVRHPIRSLRVLVRLLRSLARDIRRSTTRPRRPAIRYF